MSKPFSVTPGSVPPGAGQAGRLHRRLARSPAGRGRGRAAAPCRPSATSSRSPPARFTACTPRLSDSRAIAASRWSSSAAASPSAPLLQPQRQRGDLAQRRIGGPHLGDDGVLRLLPRACRSPGRHRSAGPPGSPPRRPHRLLLAGIGRGRAQREEAGAERAEPHRPRVLAGCRHAPARCRPAAPPAARRRRCRRGWHRAGRAARHRRRAPHRRCAARPGGRRR